MLKKLISVFLIISAVIFLISCGGGQAQNENSAADSTKAVFFSNHEQYPVFFLVQILRPRYRLMYMHVRREL